MNHHLYHLDLRLLHLRLDFHPDHHHHDFLRDRHLDCRLDQHRRIDHLEQWVVRWLLLGLRWVVLWLLLRVDVRILLNLGRRVGLGLGLSSVGIHGEFGKGGLIGDEEEGDDVCRFIRAARGYHLEFESTRFDA
ncbi:hypothetical protein HanPSC8_Chr06g0236111 [Helianthus annuus]|nr:hypothetical protein HanPSC8_Chr06g0236111 [Helianthus annuus]